MMKPYATIVLLFASCALARADDWPGWMGPNRDGTSVEKDWDPRGLKVLWRKDIGAGYAGVSVVGDRVYTMGNAEGKDTVRCLLATDGKLVWQHRYPCKGGGAGWPGTRLTPLVDEGRVITMSLKGQMHCLDAQTGHVTWRVDAPRALGAKGGRHGFSSHPVIDGKRLFVELGARGGSIVAFDKTDGTVLWRSGRFGVGHSSPVVRTIGGRRQLVVWTGSALVGMKVEDGGVLWQFMTKVQFTCNIPTPVFQGDRVFISSVYYNRRGTLLDLSRGKPKALWHTKTLQSHCSPAVVYRDHLYGFDGWVNAARAGKGTLRCVDLKTGRATWSKKGFGTGSVMIADGKLILLGDRGDLAVAEATPSRFTPLARAKVLNGRCWGMPVLSGGRIYCRSWEGKLVCVDVRKR